VEQRVSVGLVAVSYEGGPHGDLPRLRKGLEQLARLWGDLDGVERGLPDLDPSGDANHLNERLRSWCYTLTEDQVLILYWGGHGWVRGGIHYLLCRDSDTARIDGDGAVRADSIAEKVANSRAKAILVVIDACYSGEAMDRISEAIRAVEKERGSTREMGVLASARPFEPGADGLLIERILKLLDNGPITDKSRWKPTDQWIRVGAFVAEVCSVPYGPQPEWSNNLLSERNVIPNPLWVPPGPETPALQRSGARGHLLNASENFFGRRKALDGIIEWLDSSPSGICVITGQPGTGKSALLGRLARLADENERAQLEGLQPGDLRLEAGTFDAIVHAQGKSAVSLIAELALAAGVAPPNSVEHLVSLLGNRQFTALVDALDEAADNEVLSCAELLREIAQVQGVRVVVGTRRDPVVGAHTGQSPLLEFLSADKEVDLDNDPYTERDIAGYVIEQLLSEGSPYRRFPDDARMVTEEVARLVTPLFMLAKPAVRWLTREPMCITEEAGWRERLESFAGDRALTEVLAVDLHTRYPADTEKIWALLSALAWAEGEGVPRYDVWPAMARAISGRTYSDEDISNVLNTAGWYINAAGEDGRTVYRLYHRVWADLLRRRTLDVY